MAGADPFADPEERRVLFAALDSFRQYRQAAHYNITHLRRQSFYSLSRAHVDILCGPPFTLPETFDAVDNAIDANADLSEAILHTALNSFGLDAADKSWQGLATPSDMDKARSTIRQFYRDWSTEGDSERRICFEPITQALESHLAPCSTVQRNRHAILVPGAGLGRLVFDLVQSGYTVEGNEISYHQLLASNHVLNCTQRAGEYELHPWALNFSNHLRRENQLKMVKVPDVHPGTALELSMQQQRFEQHYSERMSMTAGDFCEIYRRDDYRKTFNAIVTCFFIDTAPNLLNYIETIKHCLQEGGCWINVGPLLWHFEAAPTPAERDRAQGPNDVSSINKPKATQSNQGIGEPGSFELTGEEVIALVKHMGFDIIEHRPRLDQPVGYVQDPESMLTNLYRPSFWVARKRQ